MMEEMGKPFLEECKDLLRLDVIDPAVAASIHQVEEVGKQQYEAYITMIVFWKNQYLFQSLSKRTNYCCSVDHTVTWRIVVQRGSAPKDNRTCVQHTLLLIAYKCI